MSLLLQQHYYPVVTYHHWCHNKIVHISWVAWLLSNCFFNMYWWCCYMRSHATQCKIFILSKPSQDIYNMIQFHNIYILSIPKKYNICLSFDLFLIKKILSSIFTHFKAEESYLLRIVILFITITYYNNLFKQYSTLFQQIHDCFLKFKFWLHKY